MPNDIGNLDDLMLDEVLNGTSSGFALPDLDDVLQDVAPNEDIFRVASQSSLNVNATNYLETFGLAKALQHQENYFNVIESMSLDIDNFEYILNNSPALQNIMYEGEKIYKMFPYLLQDIFMSLYKYSPLLREPNSIAKASQLNLSLLKQLVESPEWRQLRFISKMDDIKSSLGTEILAKQVIQILKDMQANIQKKKTLNPNLKDPFGAIDDMYFQEEQALQGFTEEQLKAIIGNSFNDSGQMTQFGQMIDNSVQNIQNANTSAAINSAYQDFMNGLSGAAGNVPVEVVSAAQGSMNALQATQLASALKNEMIFDDPTFDTMIDDFVQTGAFGAYTDATSQKDIMQIHETSKMIETWGFSGEQAENMRIPFEAKRSALERIRRSDKLKKITDLLGRLKQVARFEQKRKAKDGEHAIKSVELGNKLESILPSEKMLLCEKSTRGLFFQKMNDKQLLQYKKTSKKTKHKGPMIVCGDESGSMNGDPEVWLKAVIMTMLEIAQTQRRDFAYIPFASRVGKPIIIKKGTFNPIDAVNIAEQFMGGGTDFEGPLNEALKLIESSEFNKADITFITDGECGISEEFVERFNKTKEKKEFNMITILVDVSANSDASIEPLSDKVIKLSNLDDFMKEDNDYAAQLFGSV